MRNNTIHVRRNEMRTRGFTIVELLIVIVVLGILVSITVVAYTGIQKRARDVRRTEDVATIKKALEMYKIDNGLYPAVLSAGFETTIYRSSADNGIAPALEPYIKAVPKPINEPNGTAQGDQSFRYYADVNAGVQRMAFTVVYETKPPCRVVYNADPGWFGLPDCP